MALAGPLNYNRLRSYSAAGLHPCQCEEILHHRQNHRAEHDGQRAAAKHPGAGARVLPLVHGQALVTRHISCDRDA